MSQWRPSPKLIEPEDYAGQEREQASKLIGDLEADCRHLLTQAQRDYNTIERQRNQILHRLSRLDLQLRQLAEYRHRHGLDNTVKQP